MIRKLKSGEYRLYARRPGPKNGPFRDLGTFPSRERAESHERAVRILERQDWIREVVGASRRRRPQNEPSLAHESAPKAAPGSLLWTEVA
jgi:hypothetical protein